MTKMVRLLRVSSFKFLVFFRRQPLASRLNRRGFGLKNRVCAPQQKPLRSRKFLVGVDFAAAVIMDVEQFEALSMKRLFLMLVACAVPLTANAVTIDLVTIANPNNVQDFTPAGLFGRVTSTYRIGRTEVTNAQYVEFLNAKAAADPLGLYNTSMGVFSDGGITRTGADGSYVYAVKNTAIGALPSGADYTYADKAVNYISFYDALRFANWMNNGQGSGSTETGAYTLTGNTPVPTNANTITRNVGAIWFLPSEDQWYKAAYYDAAGSSYFDYPTASDTPPNNNLPAADTGNSANFLAGTTTTGDPGYPLTPVGAYTMSESAYGTFDQGGGVAEWNEALVSTGVRGLRGGSWGTTVDALSSANRGSMSANLDNSRTGLRLATIEGGSPVIGDYNNNGTVDAADYVVWRDHLGTSFQLQNESSTSTPGSVTQDDYDIWKARFGSISGSASATGASIVPEPATALLIACGAMLACAIGRRNQVAR
jgi:formylglycine-generating enzyme required for sulfatase activity